MKCVSLIILSFLSSFLFTLIPQDRGDCFLLYESEILDYVFPNDSDLKKHMLKTKEESIKNGYKYKYEQHEEIGEFCNYEFYSFNLGAFCFECSLKLAMIDNDRNTIAFLDTLTLNQTLDSINNVIKDCEQVTSPKELNDFFEKIKHIYHYNETNSIQLQGSYSSPSLNVIYLLSAENALDFEKSKKYIDYERIYNTQEEWELKVRTNPPKLDFHNYRFIVKENGRDAIVITQYEDKKTKYYLKQERYYSKSWKIVGIESD